MMAIGSVPVGYRFHPTDEELIDHYLRLKTLGRDSEVSVIPQVDINQFEPGELSRHIMDCSLHQRRNQKWYFFCRPEAKNPSKSNDSKKIIKRSTPSGQWHLTGKDRDVKSQGTIRAIIGTKRTLVFYKGRVKNASTRTNWVIHEYHLTAAHTRPAPAQRDFVLCLLKEKQDKKTSDEVEPAPAVALNNSHHTGHMAPDHESHVAQGTILDLDPYQEAIWEFLSEPTHQSPEFPSQQGPSHMDFSFSNDFSNGLEGMQIPFEDDEPEDDWRSYLVDDHEDEYPYPWAEASGQRNFAVRRSEMPESHVVRVSSTRPLRREYVKDSESSSETDTEVLQSRCDPIVEAIRSLNRNVNSGFLHDEFGGSSASSDDSAADRTFEINCIQLDSPESPVNRRTIRPQYRPTSHNFVAQGTAPRRVFLNKNLQEEAHQGRVRSSTVKQEGKPNSIEARDAAECGTATTLPQKKISIVVSDKDLGMVQEVESRGHGSAGSNQQGSIIFLETPLASHRSGSPCVYAFKVLLGIFLFIVITGEMLAAGHHK